MLSRVLESVNTVAERQNRERPEGTGAQRPNTPKPTFIAQVGFGV
jgi:hypothetical protein